MSEQSEEEDEVLEEITEAEFNRSLRVTQKEYLKVVDAYTRKYHSIDSIFLDLMYLRRDNLNVQFYVNEDNECSYQITEKPPVGFRNDEWARTEQDDRLLH